MPDPPHSNLMWSRWSTCVNLSQSPQLWRHGIARIGGSRVRVRRKISQHQSPGKAYRCMLRSRDNIANSDKPGKVPSKPCTHVCYGVHIHASFLLVPVLGGTMVTCHCGRIHTCFLRKGLGTSDLCKRWQQSDFERDLEIASHAFVPAHVNRLPPWSCCFVVAD